MISTVVDLLYKINTFTKIAGQYATAPGPLGHQKLSISVCHRKTKMPIYNMYKAGLADTVWKL